MSSDPLLELLRRNARFSHKEIADLLSSDEANIRERIKELEDEGTILGYHAVIDPESAGDTSVSADAEQRLEMRWDGFAVGDDGFDL
jgi:DNA-binding Lrp family transcriptional regulator